MARGTLNIKIALATFCSLEFLFHLIIWSNDKIYSSFYRCQPVAQRLYLARSLVFVPCSDTYPAFTSKSPTIHSFV